MATNRFYRRLVLLGAAVFVTLAAGKTAPADDTKKASDAVVAVVGSEKITEGDLDEMLALMSPPERRAYEGPEGRKTLLAILIENKVLLAEAKRLKLEKDPSVARDLEDARMRILASNYFNRYIAANLGVPDEQVKAYYDAHKEEFLVPARVTLRHILVATPEAGDAVLKRLAAGESFAAVAADATQDEYTKGQEGIIGDVSSGYIPFQVGNCEDYEKVVFSLPVKQPSALVKSDRGYHIFRVDAKTEAGYAPLDQVSMRIRMTILVPEADARAYYDAHKDQYVVEAGVLSRQLVVKTEPEAKALLGRAAAGEDFESLVKLYSTDATTKNNGGLLGWVRPGGYIQTIGRNADIEKALFAAQPGALLGPYKLEDGYHVLKVDRTREYRQLDFAEVSDRITSDLIDQRRTSYYEQAFRNLETQYKVTRYGWARTYDDMTPEELMAAAEGAATPLGATQAYDKYVERFPARADADKALFMSGFLYAEELKDYSAAKDKFRKLLSAYPQSLYAPSASWMVEHMGEEDAGPPPNLPAPLPGPNGDAEKGTALPGNETP